MRLEELRDLRCSPNVVRDDNRGGRACGEYGEYVYGLVVGREGKRPLGRPSRRLGDNIKMS